MLSETIDTKRTLSKGIIIEIPLRPRKRMISLRVDEGALASIDKFVAMTGEYSRTLVLTRLIEGLAEGLRRVNYNASSISIKLVPGNGGDPIEVVITLKSTSSRI
ncbi:MAG: hypothetical protein ACP5KA_00230 [Desulfurococcaceae archaeon]